MSLFQHAIVRRPCPQLAEGLTSVDLGKPDIQIALQQHRLYIAALQICGLEVDILPEDFRFPDSVFVEDVALCTSRCAIITNPGAPSRNGERNLISSTLEKYFNDIEMIDFPGTLEAGDVMMAGEHFYIGVTGRTNEAGAKELVKLLYKYDFSASLVPLTSFLHLKTGVSYLENNNLLVYGELEDHPAFQKYNRFVVPKEEAYAANSVWVNGKVLMPHGFPKTIQAVKEMGYPVIELELSEFQKVDGGASCLSLRF